jgi:hypothetical protein
LAIAIHASSILFWLYSPLRPSPSEGPAHHKETAANNQEAARNRNQYNVQGSKRFPADLDGGRCNR